MPYRDVALRAGQHYHLYNRGNNRQRVFFERDNYLFFLRKVREYLQGKPRGEGETSDVLETSDVYTYPATVIAYCLMPNHYHLLVRANDDRLSRYMRRLSISYTKAINRRYNRVGSLFQGRLKAVLVESDAYLLHLSRYIHLNPVLAGLVQRAEEWEFSSYRDYVGLREGTLPAPDIVLSQFPAPAAYREFVQSYTDQDRKVIEGLAID